VEVVVAAISAGIALVALVVSILVARRQTTIQERVAAIEEARRDEEVEARTRAHVTASIAHARGTEGVVRSGVRSGEGLVEAAPGPMVVWLVLRNEGPALARDVELVEEGTQPRECSGWRSSPSTCNRTSNWCSTSR
jgi:hypothetical protein